MQNIVVCATQLITKASITPHQGHPSISEWYIPPPSFIGMFQLHAKFCVSTVQLRSKCSVVNCLSSSLVGVLRPEHGCTCLPVVCVSCSVSFSSYVFPYVYSLVIISKPVQRVCVLDFVSCELCPFA